MYVIKLSELPQKYQDVIETICSEFDELWLLTRKALSDLHRPFWSGNAGSKERSWKKSNSFPTTRILESCLR
jgi:hypothetical protein